MKNDHLVLNLTTKSILINGVSEWAPLSPQKTINKGAINDVYCSGMAFLLYYLIFVVF